MDQPIENWIPVPLPAVWSAVLLTEVEKRASFLARVRNWWENRAPSPVIGLPASAIDPTRELLKEETLPQQQQCLSSRTEAMLLGCCHEWKVRVTEGGGFVSHLGLKREVRRDSLDNQYTSLENQTSGQNVIIAHHRKPGRLTVVLKLR